jgi:hypothetical protein
VGRKSVGKSGACGQLQSPQPSLRVQCSGTQNSEILQHGIIRAIQCDWAHSNICSRPETTPILSQLNPVLTPTSHLLKIHPNIILPSTPRSPQRSLSLRLPHQNPVHTSPFPNTCYMLRLSQTSRFYHPQDIG